MTTATATPPAEKVWTTEALLALPDDGIERWIVNGKLVEVGMTIRNKYHTRVQSRVSYLLEAWLEAQPSPRGTIHAGEAGVRLRKNPDLTVGIDLVYLAPDVSARVMADESTTIIDAVPTLAVEILSPSDTLESIEGKANTYRVAGIPLVWEINPYRRIVTVFRPGQQNQTLQEGQELDGGPELPGFRVPVARLLGE